MIAEGFSSPRAREELVIMCARDPLFTVNTFVWTFDPRLLPNPTIVPFITYAAYQDEALLEILDAILYQYDILIEKSRDMGASWLIIVAFWYLWQFRRNQAFRLVSRVEDLVDRTEDPDSLFWKIDLIIKSLPSWLRPNIGRSHLHLYNRDMDSVINGSSTTGDVARGGRCGAMLLDEFAAVKDGHAVLSSTRDVTGCRVFNSTPKGVGNAFYDQAVNPGIRKLRFHWSQHPVKAAGLYVARNGKLEILDEGYDFPPGYEFVLDGKMRSPWYDKQCQRAAHAMEIAQELDIDYLGSDFQFFDPEIVRQIQASDVKDPIATGELEYDDDALEHQHQRAKIRFTEASGGRFCLWTELHPATGLPPDDDDYVVAVDISAGTGASNSAISVGRRRTREKVAEFVTPWVKPEGLARTAYAIGKFFHNAFMIWDAGGHGQVFGDTLWKMGYHHVYFRENDKSITKKVSDIPGVFLQPDTKLAILGAYRKALSDRAFVQRSYHANRELLQYVFTSQGQVEHASATHNIDPSGARKNHGDRVIADALLWKGIQFVPVEDQINIDSRVKSIRASLETFAGRRKLHEQKLQVANSW